MSTKFYFPRDSKDATTGQVSFEDLKDAGIAVCVVVGAQGGQHADLEGQDAGAMSVNPVTYPFTKTQTAAAYASATHMKDGNEVGFIEFDDDVAQPGDITFEDKDGNPLGNHILPAEG